VQVSSTRIHLAGSASRARALDKLTYAHDLVTQLVRRLAVDSATFVLTVGREPLLVKDEPSSPSIIFDWTVLATIRDCLQEGLCQAQGSQGKLITAVVTEKTDAQIPPTRRELWDFLLTQGALRLEYVTSDWTSGAIRRQQAVQIGSLFIAISGGEGVEHLAQEYLAAGKPVIPIDLDLGASTDVGEGRAVRMARRARAEPNRFIDLRDSSYGAEIFTATVTHDGTAPIPSVVQGILSLITALKPPRVFYVRLLDPDDDDWKSVESYFRDVVDPVVKKLGFEGVEMSRQSPITAWMNVEIFERLHHAHVVLVDLTGLRTNCFMEMGYSFGHRQRVLIMAREGTRVPFDPSSIEYLPWKDNAPDKERMLALETYWSRHIDRPPLVRPQSLP